MDACTPTPMAIGTPTPTSSATASYYPSSPIDSSMSSIGIEETFDVDSESDELDTDTQEIKCAGRGGQPPLLREKRPRNVKKKSIVWEHFTKDLNSPEYFLVAHCNYCGVKYKCHGKNKGISNMLYHVQACQE
jgi:hypothetical protein